ncbi:hypothetical protein PSACC_02825 [Paramicrosporidium saccamoebae]|uniref:Uncharacterized protein n=1 Tax=Paramicrosporidium saccamoebae TaxID=1246581 RepID=A0A2H9THY2_9FUNG|nr:hypothetical protein PSACC_02825 [Paramicrosporidium saccamoebae]
MPEYDAWVARLRDDITNKKYEIFKPEDLIAHDKFNIADGFNVDLTVVEEIQFKGDPVIAVEQEMHKIRELLRVNNDKSKKKDEVCSIVVDLGTRQLRVGYSGDERPSVVIPSQVGTVTDGQYFFGDLALSFPRASMEIKPVISGTEVLDWNLLEKLLVHSVGEKLGAKWTEHPVLFVDNPMWSRETREKLVQMFFDKFDVPAVFLGRAPVLAAFAMGKHSALVIDCGASAIRVGPIFEGYLIKAGALHQPLLGGDALTSQARTILLDDLKIGPLHIPQQVEHKFPVELSQPAKMEPKMLKDVTDSFMTYHQNLVLDDFKESTVQISELSFNGTELARRPPKYYEFPDGYNRNFVIDRFRLGEQLFHPGQFRHQTGEPAPSSVIGLAELINKSLQQCDAEVRGSLIGNLILTGGGSSLNGLSERLNFELGRMPTYISPSSHERRFGAWIGGSILASLSTFQQLWLTKQEYKEHGASYIDRKCP